MMKKMKKLVKKYHLIILFQFFQGIYALFQAIVELMDDTLLQNLTTANQRTPIFNFLCIEMLKIMNKYAVKIIFDWSSLKFCKVTPCFMV